MCFNNVWKEMFKNLASPLSRIKEQRRRWRVSSGRRLDGTGGVPLISLSLFSLCSLLPLLSLVDMQVTLCLSRLQPEAFCGWWWRSTAFYGVTARLTAGQWRWESASRVETFVKIWFSFSRSPTVVSWWRRVAWWDCSFTSDLPLSMAVRL